MPEALNYQTADDLDAMRAEPFAASGASRYGAQMGRPRAGSAHDDGFIGKAFLRAVPIDAGGYDPGGAYWGLRPRGERLFCAWAHEDGGVLFVRWIDAPNRQAAARILREDFPNACIHGAPAP